MSASIKTNSQSEIRSLAEGCKILYETKELFDVIFKIKGAKNFKAHKLILAARSTKFQRLLWNLEAEKVVLIENESITPNGFEILLRFIYTDVIGTEEKLSIIEAFLAAEYYEQKALRDLLVKKMNSWVITVDDVWKLLDVGLNIPVLKEKCLAFIRNNASVAISHPTFQNISFNCLSDLLKNGVLSSVPALKRLDKIMAWAGQHYTNRTELHAISMRNYLEQSGLLSKLGIETLKLEELRTVVKKFKGLLTSDEVVQFMEYSEDKNATFLPSWCVPTT